MPRDFSNREALELMNRTVSEMTELRNRIATLEPKAHAYDTLCTVLGLLPQRSRGMSEDFMRVLKKHIAELQAPAPEPVNRAPTADELAAERGE